MNKAFGKQAMQISILAPRRALNGARAAIAALIAVCSLGAAPIATAQLFAPYTITDLGVLSGLNDTDSTAYAISPTGTVVGVSGIFVQQPPYWEGFRPSHAFMWVPDAANATTGFLQDLGGLPGNACGSPKVRFDTRVYDINSHNHAVGNSLATDPFGKAIGTCPPSLYHGVMFDDGWPTDINDIPGLTANHWPRYPTSINEAGQIVGNYQVSSSQSNAWFLDTEYHDLGTLPDLPLCTVSKINNNKQIIGNCASADFYTSHGFLHAGSDPITADDDIGDFAAIGLNDRGLVVGAYPLGDGSSRAGLRTFMDGTISSLPALLPAPYFQSTATAINNGNHVVGSSLATPTARHAVLWRGLGVPPIDLNSFLAAGTAWELITANSINDAGQIVGMGMLHGQRHAFLLTPCGDAGGDSDGDGLCDDWEKSGVYVTGANGNMLGFVDLPAMGANPLHKDIFVHADYMVAADHTHQPKLEAIDQVVAAFANAPVANPDGKSGIALHVDCGPECIMDPVTGAKWGALSRAQVVVHAEVIGSTPSSGNFDWADMGWIKATHFPPERGAAFRYALFAHLIGYYDDNGNLACEGLAMGMPSSDFIVGLGNSSGEIGTVSDQAATFMHELGHTLGLGHGGADSLDFKPNYLSVMNNLFRFGPLLHGTDEVLDYSRHRFPDLDEAHLDETAGLGDPVAASGYSTRFFCPGSYAGKNAHDMVLDAASRIEWLCDSDQATQTDVQANINGDVVSKGPGKGQPAIDVLTGFDDWANLVYRGGSIGGMRLGPSQYSTLPVIQEMPPGVAALNPRPFGVTVVTAGITNVLPNAATTSSFTVTNTGVHADTYDVSATATTNWWSVATVPATLTLAPGASAQVAVAANVPAVAAGTQGVLSIVARSQLHPLVLDVGAARLVVGSAPALATVPNVVGAASAVATAAITSASLTVGTLTPQPSASVAAGKVMAQSLIAGSLVPLGSLVDLIVSSGQAPVAVPNVVGQTQANASTAITALGLVVGAVTTQPSATVPAGSVISQAPSAGATVAFGSTVTLVVSAGLTKVVPDIVGKTQAAAGTAITAAGLILGTVSTAPSPSVPSGSVISQTPPAGTAVMPASAVNLVISGGSAVTVPDVVGQNLTPAVAAITAASLTTDGYPAAQHSATAPVFEIIAQTPAGGSPAIVGARVDLAVSQGPAQVAVPNIIGLTKTQASSALLAVGLVLGTNEGGGDWPKVAPTYVADGLVIEQPPAAGTLAAGGSVVKRVLSAGVAYSTPSFVGMDHFAAMTAAGNWGLVPAWEDFQYSATAPSGVVLAQTPAAGTPFGHGYALSMVVSLGLPPAAVPNVVGLTQGQATAALTSAQLVGALTLEFSATVPEGTVLSQVPAAGTPVNGGSTVTLAIASIAPTNTIVTVAGNRARSSQQSDPVYNVPATSTSLYLPSGVAVAADGSVYISQDRGWEGVLRVDGGSGLLTAYAGWTQTSGVRAYGQGDGGPAHQAPLTTPKALALSQDGSLHIGEWQSCHLRKVDPSGTISTVAGSYLYNTLGGTWGVNGSCVGIPARGNGDGGPATRAFLAPRGLVTGPDGSVYVSDQWNQTIRRIDAFGNITRYAGIGTPGYGGDGGPALQAALNVPNALALGPDGSLYVVDGVNVRVRRISPNGTITTVAGNGHAGYSGDGGPATQASISTGIIAVGVITDGQYAGIAVARDGTVYLADPVHNVIRKVGVDGTICTVVGTGVAGNTGDGGSPLQATLYSPAGIALGPDGSLYIADYRNSLVRRVTPPMHCPSSVAPIVPDVVGKPRASAATDVPAAGLVIGTEATQPSSTVPAGSVVSQSPAAGITVALGSAVNLVLSSGSGLVPVPNVVGQTQSTALSKIAASGLSRGLLATRPSTTVAPGTAIVQAPAAGTLVEPGVAVDLVLSSGSAAVLVPDVVGQTQADANVIITGTGLAIGESSAQPSPTVPAGHVLSQSPIAGASVAPGSAVSVVLSLGPAVVVVPTVASIAPANGPSGGGTAVTITGANFTGVAAVTIGGAAATGVNVLNPTTITATTPAGVPGAQSVVVTTAGGPSTGSTAFTYIQHMLDVDGNGSTEALTDGLLVIRFLFGLSGQALINGAVGPNPSRGDADSIASYLTSIGPALDVDRNGHGDALTDGLLILRFLLGLRGDDLINNAVDPLGARVAAPAIETYLDSLVQPLLP